MTVEELNFFNAPLPVYVSPEVRRAQRIAATLPRPCRPVACPRPRNQSQQFDPNRPQQPSEPTPSIPFSL